MASYQVTFAIDDKDIEDLQSAMVAMAQSEFDGVKDLQMAIRNSGLGSWLKAQVSIAEAMRP